MKKTLINLQRRLVETRPSSRKYDFKSEDYIGGGESKLSFHGHRVPFLRQLFENEFQLQELDFEKQMKIWDYVFRTSKNFEAKSLSLYWMERQNVTDLLRSWPTFSKWAHHVDNWAHSDGLCGVYSKLLEAAPKVVYPDLKKWNRSDEPWLIRISIVSLFYYARFRRKYPKAAWTEDFIRRYWHHKHYYLQKAIGWTLREYATAYPKQGNEFIRQNALRASSTAFSAAVERWTQKERQPLKQQRVAFRKGRDPSKDPLREKKKN